MNAPEDSSGTAEEDLWFLPGPLEEEPDLLPPGSGPAPSEGAMLADWVTAEAGHAARLARVAGRLGALGARLRRGPEGLRHRLALIEAADLSWFAGDRVPEDRLALWNALRISSIRDDVHLLMRAGWAVRRLKGGTGPLKDLSAFLARRTLPGQASAADRFADRAEGWLTLMAAGGDLHPITRACMGFHLWAAAGLSVHGDPLEAAVAAARIAAEGASGAVFAPLAMGGAGGLRAVGDPAARLRSWLDGMERAILTAERHLDRVEAWTDRAMAAMSGLSGRTPGGLRTTLAEWPILSAPMAEALTGASRAAVQRNLAWMEAKGLIREITRQGRFRFWRAAI